MQAIDSSAVSAKGKSRLSSPTIWVALVFVGVGIVGVFLGRHATLQEWGPHIAVTAFALAITITVVEWIVRSEANARIRPRVTRAHSAMDLNLGSFMRELLSDYGATHRDTSQPIPKSARKMIELWLADQPNEDTTRVARPGQTLPALMAAATVLKSDLEEIRSRDVDVIEPGLVAAMDKFGNDVHGAMFPYRWGVERADGGEHKHEARFLRAAVEAVLDLVSSFEHYVGDLSEISEADRKRDWFGLGRRG